MKTLPLSQGKVALVDDADFEQVSQFKWYADRKGKTFYAARSLKREKGNTRKQIYLHQMIMGAKHIDHVDGDGLNNQRMNLRPCSQKENSRNRIGTPHSSPFKGVCWAKDKNKWKAYIRVNYHRHNLGFYFDPAIAALAYDLAAKKHFGEFARTNVL